MSVDFYLQGCGENSLIYIHFVKRGHDTLAARPGVAGAVLVSYTSGARVLERCDIPRSIYGISSHPRGRVILK